MTPNEVSFYRNGLWIAYMELRRLAEVAGLEDATTGYNAAAEAISTLYHAEEMKQ